MVGEKMLILKLFWSALLTEWKARSSDRKNIFGQTFSLAAQYILTDCTLRFTDFEYQVIYAI